MIDYRKRGSIVEHDAFLDGTISEHVVKAVNECGRGTHVYWYPTADEQKLDLSKCFGVSHIFLQYPEGKPHFQNFEIVTPTGEDSYIHLDGMDSDDKIKITVPSNDCYRTVYVNLPKTSEKHGPSFDKLHVYKDITVIDIHQAFDIKAESKPSFGRIGISKNTPHEVLDCIAERFGLDISVVDVTPKRELTKEQLIALSCMHCRG